jgi:hypothetical protein
VTSKNRWSGAIGLLGRICTFLLDVLKGSQDPQNAPRPGFKRHDTTPNPQVIEIASFTRDTKWSRNRVTQGSAKHPMLSAAGGPAGRSGNAATDGGNAEAEGQKNDTKSASHCIISVYARHQMEPHDVQAGKRHHVVLSGLTTAENRLPDSGRSERWRTEVCEKRHQFGKFI